MMSMLRWTNVVAADVLDVRQRAGLEVVDADHPVLAPEQLVAQMRAEEAGATGDEARSHARNLQPGSFQGILVTGGLTVS